MPNSASASKRLRQSQDRRLKNRSARTAVRSQIKKLRKAIDEGDAAACDTEFRITVKKLDQAAAKNLMHKNAAARTKSRLSKAVLAVKKG